MFVFSLDIINISTVQVLRAKTLSRRSLVKFSLVLKLFHRRFDSQSVSQQPDTTPSRFGTSGGVGRVGAAIIQPLIEAPSARVHEEVADGGELQAQLLRDSDL